MRWAPALAAALCLTVTGCSTSDIDPDATVRISGRALDAAGEPLSGASVLLFKQADVGEVLLGTALTIGTLSTICLLPEPPAVCNEAHTATTDESGRYDYELKGSDTQGTLGTESTLTVVFAGPSAQGSTAVSFTAEETSIDLPDARLWRARPEVSQPPGGVGLTWSPLPKAVADDAAYSVELFDGQTEAAFWSQDASGGEAAIDPRILEDRPASVAIGAGADLSGGTGAGDLRVNYLSNRSPVEATAGAPPSRGRPCAAVTGSKPRLADPPDSCPLTDGDLTTPAQLDAEGASVVTGVVVDLGSVRPVELVVVRRFAGQFLVEVSTNGKAWQPVGSPLGATVAVDPPSGTSARFVRVRSPSGLDESLAAEVSVW